MKSLPPYVIVQGCPVPRQLAPFLITVLHESGASLQSCYRGDDASALLARYGKHSQKWLYDHQGRPEQPNPANPPGVSTHELRNDGAAYSQWARGAKIPWWACGIDIDDAHVVAFIEAAKRHGWVVSRTYPNQTREYHHVNFRKPPLVHRLFKGYAMWAKWIKGGRKGPRPHVPAQIPRAWWKRLKTRKR